MRDLYGWFNRNLKGRKGQQGFTLIELLVVVTILGILAAIVTLSLVGLTTHANTQACNSEYKTVQAALDSYMANKNLFSLPAAQTTWTNDMTGGTAVPAPAFPGNVQLFRDVPSGDNPNYTRNGTTQFYYKWDQYGKITAIAADSVGGVVQGCAPK